VKELDRLIFVFFVFVIIIILGKPSKEEEVEGLDEDGRSQEVKDLDQVL
jgi:hypothetical protein